MCVPRRRTLFVVRGVRRRHRRYFLLLSTLSCLITLVLASSFTFAFPGVLQQPFVDPDTWAYRFRIVTMLGFNLPMVRHVWHTHACRRAVARGHHHTTAPSTARQPVRCAPCLGGLSQVVVALYKTWTWDWSNVPRDNLEQFLQAQGVALPPNLFADLGKLHTPKATHRCAP